MKYINTYSKFKSKNWVDMQYKYLSNINMDNDEEMFENICINIYNQLSKNEQLIIDKHFPDVKINENFWSKLTSRVDKASEVSNVLSDETESILKKVLRKAGEAFNFVKQIIENIKNFITSIITTVRDKVLNKAKGDKELTNKVKELVSVDKNAFVKDLKTSKEVYSFYKGDFLSSIMKSMKDNLSNFFSKEQEPIAEALINEKGNVISTMVHGIEKIPPFSWLHKVAHLGEKGADKIIEGLSFLTNKLGGPSFKLPVIATILGIVFEYNIKGAAKSGILSILGDAFTGGLISIISIIATFIAGIIIIDQISGEKILGH